MSSNPNPPSPETVDRNIFLMIAVMFLLALLQGLEATQLRLTDVGTATFLGRINTALTLVILAAAAFLMVYKIRVYRSVGKQNRASFWEPESYVYQLVHRALVYSWAATLLTLYGVVRFGDRWDYGTEFYCRVALGIMLAVFSMAFVILYHRDSDQEEDV